VIDVGCDRLGDALGAAVVQILLLYRPEQVFAPILLGTMIFAAICIWIGSRMDAAYLRVVEQGLLHRAFELDVNELRDSTTISAVMRSVAQSKISGPPIAEIERPPSVQPKSNDPAVDLLKELRSGDASRIKRVLSSQASFEAIAIPQVIRLLAWNEAAEAARAYLSRHASRIAGQLTDWLLDPNVDFAVRRRVPRILAHCPSQRVVDGLLGALDDPHFELRFQAARALEYIHRTTAGLMFDNKALMQTVERELSVAKPIWEGRKLLDQRDDSDAQYYYLDDSLRDRTHQSLEHVFSLLAIVLPREPVKIAFRALHSDDRQLRGLALEYMETTLPAPVFTQLTRALESAPASKPARDANTVLGELMGSRDIVLSKIKNAFDGAPAPGVTPPTAKST
jgi:hypothetical protein